MDRAFSAGAFALKTPGEISEPVLSAYGYHLIRLEGRKPAELPSFDAVKDTIMADLKREFIDARKLAAMKGITADPTLEVNQPAIDALPATLGAAYAPLPAAKP